MKITAGNWRIEFSKETKWRWSLKEMDSDAVILEREGLEDANRAMTDAIVNLKRLYKSLVRMAAVTEDLFVAEGLDEKVEIEE